MANPPPREKQIDQFEAIDDAGNLYTVIEWQRVAFMRDVRGILHAVDGTKRLALSTGEHVNPREDGSFQIFETETIIRKVG